LTGYTAVILFSEAAAAPDKLNQESTRLAAATFSFAPTPGLEIT